MKRRWDVSNKIDEIRAIWRGMPVDVHIDEDGDLSTNDEDGDGEPFGSLAGNEGVNKVFCRARADVFCLLGEVERLTTERDGAKAMLATATDALRKMSALVGQLGARARWRDDGKTRIVATSHLSELEDACEAAEVVLRASDEVKP